MSEVTAGLSPVMQELFQQTAERQRRIAPLAAAALRGAEVGGAEPDELREAAAVVLINYAEGNVVPGYQDVPLSFEFGKEVLPDGVRAVSSCFVDIEESPNHFGMRPNDPANRANLLAVLAIHGLGPEDMVTMNTGSNGNHVAVVSHGESSEGGLVSVGGRTLPADGEGEKLTADAVIVTDPTLQKGIIGACADNPLAVGVAGGALVMINGGWNNLAAGVDLTARAKIEELGLDEGVVLAVGPGARNGFSVRLTKLVDGSADRAALGGDPRSFENAIQPNEADSAKVDLELTRWAGQSVAAFAEVADVDLCTVDGGRDGYMHSSRVHRTAPTVPGQMAGGDRNVTMIFPVAAQRDYAKIA